MRKAISIVMILIGIFFIGLSVSMRIKSFDKDDSKGLKDVSRTIMIYVSGSDLESEKEDVDNDIEDNVKFEDVEDENENDWENNSKVSVWR